MSAPRARHALRGRRRPAAALGRLASGSAWALAVLLAATTARAGGTFDLWGADVRSRGVGGARTATGGGSAAAHYNPAALGFTDRPELSVSFHLSEPGVVLELDRELDEGDSLQPILPDAYAGWTVGFVFPFTGILEDWLTFGVQVLFPAQVLTHLRAHDPGVPFLYMYDSYTDHYEATLGLSLEPFPWFAAGVGLRYAAGQRGLVEAVIDPLQQRVVEQRIDAWQYSVVAPTLGVTVGPIGWDFLRVQAGASYWDKLSQPMSVIPVIQFRGLDASLTAPLESVSNFSPRTLSAGIAVSSSAGGFWDKLALLGTTTLALDVSYQFWSEAPSPFLDVNVVSGGDDLDALGLGGLLNLPGEDQGRVREVGFVDTLRVRLGLEHRFLDDLVTLRAGWGYRPSPVPDQTSGTNIVDTSAHVLSAGAGLAFGAQPFVDGDITVDASWQTHVLVPRSVAKTAADDPVGGWAVSGALHEAGLQLGYRF